MTHNIFVNAQPALLGSDTHAADLTGSVNALNGVNDLNYTIVDGSGSSTVTNLNVEFVYDTHTLTATEPVNKGFIKYTNRITTNSSGSVDRSATFRLREDDINGAILSTQTTPDVGPGGGGGASTNTSVNITNQPIGARTYVRTLELGVSIILYGFNGGVNTSVGPVTLVQYLVDIDDTHAGLLTGANTQTAPPGRSVFT